MHCFERLFRKALSIKRENKERVGKCHDAAACRQEKDPKADLTEAKIQSQKTALLLAGKTLQRTTLEIITKHTERHTGKRSYE